MKVRSRSRLILVVTIVIFLITLSYIVQSVILASFQNIEKQEMTAHIQRAVTNLNNQEKSLALICKNLATREEMYVFLADNRSSGPRQTTPHISSGDYAIDYLLLYNSTGTLVYAENSSMLVNPNDPDSGKLDTIVRNSIIPEGFPVGISGRHGMSSINGEPAILTGYPVLHANRSDHPAGTLILVMTLNEERVGTLESELQVPKVSLCPYSPSLKRTLSPEEETTIAHGGIITRQITTERFEGITSITGIENKPTSLMLSIETARPVYQQVQASLIIFGISIIIFSSVFLIAVQLLLQRFILAPISNLDREMKMVGEDSSITRRVDESGDEEIASLKRSLNRMLDKIQHYHKELHTFQETLKERNEQLMELNRKANLYLDIYLDVITYEILNAMMGLHGYADLIKDMTTGKEAEFADKIESIAKKSSNVIRNIETISQIYKNPPQNHPVDLGSTIKNEAQLWPDSTIRIEQCNRWVLANNMLGVVFNNLFSNSAKYGGRNVQIQVICRDTGTGYVEVTVSDDGPGIPDGMKKKIFDRFASDSKIRSCYGLGLHIVKMLIESYGGKVWADNRVPGEPGKGAAIRFTLRNAEEHRAGYNEGS